jgi:hypothetical protein
MHGLLQMTQRPVVISSPVVWEGFRDLPYLLTTWAIPRRLHLAPFNLSAQGRRTSMPT